jgi:hypothetical protein
MFSSQPGTTAMRPSVSSQEIDSNSVIIQPIIQPTHIPQDQALKDGAAMSSGLSQERPSWMWWQSRDVQWEELLDAVTVETTEVKPES